MAWEALVAAAYGEWNKQRAAENAAGSPALALAARRQQVNSGDWIVATGGSKVDARRDVLPGVDSMPVPLNYSMAGASLATPSWAVVGLVVVLAYMTAKLRT